LHIPKQSVHITNKVVSFIPARGELYSIHFVCTTLCENVRQVSDFLWVL